jgi:hypothetical protein
MGKRPSSEDNVRDVLLRLGAAFQSEDMSRERDDDLDLGHIFVAQRLVIQHTGLSIEVPLAGLAKGVSDVLDAVAAKPSERPPAR